MRIISARRARGTDTCQTVILVTAAGMALPFVCQGRRPVRAPTCPDEGHHVSQAARESVGTIGSADPLLRYLGVGTRPGVAIFVPLTRMSVVCSSRGNVQVEKRGLLQISGERQAKMLVPCPRQKGRKCDQNNDFSSVTCPRAMVKMSCLRSALDVTDR